MRIRAAATIAIVRVTGELTVTWLGMDVPPTVEIPVTWASARSATPYQTTNPLPALLPER